MGGHVFTRGRVVAVLGALALPLLGAGYGSAAEVASTPPETTSSGATEASPLDEPYSAILLNPFIGNDWRPQMQRYAQAAVALPPLSDYYEGVRIVTTQDNDPTQQATALQSAILDDPDVIVMVAASETALNAGIREACDAGITIVSFDVFASEECGWRLGPDWQAVGRSWATWMAESVGGEGSILVDRGEPGTSSSDGMNIGIDEVLSEYPDVEVVEYNSKFNPGEETRLVSQLLAANPDIVGVISQAYAAQEAMDAAGVDLPATGFNYPDAMANCVDRDAPCMLVGVPPWISADALKLAAEARSGQIDGPPRYIPFPVPLFANNTDVVPPTENLGEVLDLPEQLAGDVPEGAFLPLSPPWVDIPFDEILG